MAINGQTQPQKFSLYRYREGQSDPEHGKWFKRQDQGGPNKRTMHRLLLTLGLVAISLRSSLYAEDPIRYDPVSQQATYRIWSLGSAVTIHGQLLINRHYTHCPWFAQFSMSAIA